MDATILRVGQLCGSSEDGSWAMSESEWVPTLVKASVSVGCMPALEGVSHSAYLQFAFEMLTKHYFQVVSWLPKRAATQAIVDVLTCPPGYALPVVNIVHPQHVSAREVLEAINAELDVQLPFVSPAEWAAKVQELADSSIDSERLRAIAVGAADVAAPYELGGHPLFETAKAKRVSPTLAGLRPLGQHDVHAWVRAWREGGYL